jgi:hypothetical protein
MNGNPHCSSFGSVAVIFSEAFATFSGRGDVGNAVVKLGVCW